MRSSGILSVHPINGVTADMTVANACAHRAGMEPKRDQLIVPMGLGQRPGNIGAGWKRVLSASIIGLGRIRTAYSLSCIYYGGSLHFLCAIGGRGSTLQFGTPLFPPPVCRCPHRTKERSSPLTSRTPGTLLFNFERVFSGHTSRPTSNKRPKFAENDLEPGIRGIFQKTGRALLMAVSD